MSTRQKALITGITGQDGSYLVELLLEKGYVPEASLWESARHNPESLYFQYETNRPSLQRRNNLATHAKIAMKILNNF